MFLRMRSSSSMGWGARSAGGLLLTIKKRLPVAIEEAETSRSDNLGERLVLRDGPKDHARNQQLEHDSASVHLLGWVTN